MLFVFLLTVAFLVYGVLEYRIHLTNLTAIPIRIHVNGTRGKSSVTRLIAAGLRAGGVRTVAKTTGTAARYVGPDGSEDTIPRLGPPNIREQLAVVRRARRDGARAIVVECMAVRPHLQSVCEEKILKSTVGAITNVRPDHLDAMGTTVDDVAAALAETVPRGGVLFTAERERLGSLAAAASERRSELREVAAEQYGSGITAGFGYVEHAENIALSLAVCERHGVPRDVALAGMRTASPDPGALTIHRVRRGAKEIEFVNGFAANDPESTVAVWRALARERDPSKKTIVIVSTRRDRPDRARQYAKVVAEGLRADHFILTGDLASPVRAAALRRGLPEEKMTNMSGRTAEEVFEKVFELATDDCVVVGVGNMGGIGREIAAFFQSRSVPA